MSAYPSPERRDRSDRRLAPAGDLQAMPTLLTVAEAAEALRVGRSWIYAHAAELGAVKLGTGQTAPLRIPRDGVLRLVGGTSAALPPATEAHETGSALAALRPRPRL